MDNVMIRELKTFIEKNIELIDKGDFESLYELTQEESYNNDTVKLLYDMLLQADIDTTEARDNCLYKLLSNICANAIASADNTLHSQLVLLPNWFGYDIFDIIDFLDQMSYNLGVKLIRTPSHIYNAQNYKIVEL